MGQGGRDIQKRAGKNGEVEMGGVPIPPRPTRVAPGEELKRGEGHANKKKR